MWGGGEPTLADVGADGEVAANAARHRQPRGETSAGGLARWAQAQADRAAARMAASDRGANAADFDGAGTSNSNLYKGTRATSRAKPNKNQNQFHFKEQKMRHFVFDTQEQARAAGAWISNAPKIVTFPQKEQK